MNKVRISFKDPDAIYDILEVKHPLPKDQMDITNRMEQDREKFCEKYFEYGDYGLIEIDASTLECRLVPRNEW